MLHARYPYVRSNRDDTNHRARTGFAQDDPVGFLVYSRVISAIIFIGSLPILLVAKATLILKGMNSVILKHVHQYVSQTVFF